MRGYGHDYDNRNWIERAGDTVRGWFGAGDYDRDYGGYGGQGEYQSWRDTPTGAGWTSGGGNLGRNDWNRGGMNGGMSGGGNDWDRGGMSGGGNDWSRGGPRGRYTTNNWNNQHTTRDSMRGVGGYYNADYQQGTHPGGYRGNAGRPEYDHDFGWRDWGGGRDMNRGQEMNRGGQEMNRGGARNDRGFFGGREGREWAQNDYGIDSPYNAGEGMHGDYGGGYGGDRWRNADSGGVAPGRYFRGYGNGQANRYDPY